MINMRELIAKALKEAGNIYLQNIVLSPSGPAFDPDVAEFAINFATASRSDETTKTIAAAQLPFFFKGEKMYSLIENKVIPAGGVLTWVKCFAYGNTFQIDIKKEDYFYNIKYYRVAENEEA